MKRIQFLLGAFLLASPIAGCAGDSTPDENTDTESDEIKVCAKGATVKGVDVSKYQGNVDWKQAHSHGIAFAFARVSDGTGYKDPEFADNWSGMKAAGVIRGSYQFFRPGQDPIKQADLLISTIKAHGGLQDGDLPPALDVEVQDGVSDATLRQNALKWLQHVEAAFGRRPLIYTAPGFWAGLGAGGEFTKYTLWVANWETSCPTMPTSWSGWKFWQSADNGHVAGISGNVDLDVFNGSLADLKAFANTPSSGGGDDPGGAESGVHSLAGNVSSWPAVGKNADGRLEVFAVGSKGNMLTTFQTEPNGKWSDWYSLGGNLAGQPSIANDEDGRMEAFARGADGALWHAHQSGPNGSFGNFTSLGGVITSDPVAALTSTDQLEVFAIGTDKAVHHKWQTAPNGGWSAWDKLGTGGGGLSDPRLVTMKDKRLAVFARGADKALWVSEHQSSGWTAFKSLGGQISGAPAPSHDQDGRMEIFARGADGALWHIWETTPGGAWSAWASLGGTVSDPTALRNHDGTIDVFVRGADSALHRIAQKTPNAGWGSWTKMGGSMAGGAVAGINKDGRMEVFFRTPGSAVSHAWETAAGQW